MKRSPTNSLARLLASSGHSQTELSERSGVPRETINKLANGRFGPIRPTIVISLAWALGVQPDELADLCEWMPLGPRSRAS